MLDVLIDSLIDTLKLAPIIILVHLAIEFFERKTAGSKKLHRVLLSPAAPAVGAAVGIIPQCGFSVVSANLYATGKISLGTLLAVFIATSDEAIPILLSDITSAPKLLPLLLIKFVLAVAVGYIVHFAFKNGFKFGKSNDVPLKAEESACHDVHEHTDGNAPESECAQADEIPQADENVHELHGCHGHTVTGKKESFGSMLLHPLLHSFTVLGFIFLVNFLIGTAVYFIGEENIVGFLGKTKLIQPFVAALIGLIPNCAASVVITRLYAIGGLSLGAAVAGLSAGAGIGYAVLFKENKNVKENVLIVAFAYALCSLVGLIVNLIV